MVSWTGDGLISGYDANTKRLVPNLYHLASPGTVNLNGITRLGYNMGAGLSAATYPNRIDVSAPITLTATDMSNNAGKYVGMALYWVDAAYFPDGFVPKPSDIVALGDSKVNVDVSDLFYGPGGTGATHTFTMYTGNLDNANIKFWFCVLPVATTNLSGPTTIANYPPAAGVDIDTVGRCVSLWTLRSPGKPVITSPTPNAIVSPGNTFTLTYNPNHPDEVSPEDTKKYNDDVAGVQIQYAAAPTAADPNPTWRDLLVGISTDGSDVFLDDCWIVKGVNGSGTARLRTLPAVVDNLGLSIFVGRTATDPHVEGQGELPTGDWQLRVRTYSFGHPYPNEGTDYSMPGPLGINQNTTIIFYPAKDKYPSVMVSPWSDPVKVSIPSQVPPPIPLSPTDHEAVAENTTVRLNWQYRNTHVPAFNQYFRTVQIRKVGDPNWASVFNGVSGNAYVDLPPTITQSSLPPISGLADGSFEGGTVDGWSTPVGTGYSGETLTNTLDATEAHSGSRFLKVTNNGTDTHKSCDIQRTWLAADLPSTDYINLSFDGWVYMPDPSVHPVLIIQGVWYDASDNPLLASPSGVYDSPYFLSVMTDEVLTGAGWYKISALPPYLGDSAKYMHTAIKRPPGAVKFSVFAQVACNTGGFTISEARWDDLTVTFAGAQLDSFSMSALNEYEWRVQTTDTMSVLSNYSEPARFWVVPGADTGPGRAVPSETIEGATLGCGTHRVQVFRRGGSKYVGEIRGITHLDYSRVRDDISTAQVVISGWDIDCGNLLAKLQCWAYEVVIWRNNGYSEDRVWEGPITLLTYENDKVTIDAKDVMAYAYRRIIKQKMTDVGTGNGTTVVDRARRVLQNVFAPDDPNLLGYLRVLARGDDAMQYRSTPAYSRTAFEEIDDMAANAGLDYTTVGRSIMLWGTKHRIGTLPEFTDEDLGNSPIVSEYGMSMANRYVVSDGNGVWGEATKGLDVSGNDETYGLVEMLSSTWASDSPSASGTYTQAGLATVIDSFESFAARSIADRYPPPVVVRIPDNTSLNPGAVISIQHLVPGVVIPLRSTKTLRTVVASQKLDSVKVVEEGGKETVSITVSPFSQDDAATEGA